MPTKTPCLLPICLYLKYQWRMLHIVLLIKILTLSRLILVTILLTLSIIFPSLGEHILHIAHMLL